MNKHIYMLSGGKDSTCMIIKAIEKSSIIDEIIFCDTGKEFPDMYNHINQLEKYINTKITKVSFNFDYWFKSHIKTKGKNIGNAGYSWPHQTGGGNTRWCTRLKEQTIKKYLKNKYGKNEYKNIIHYMGITSNEQNRIDKNKDGRIIEYPLIKYKMTEKDTLEYCYKKGFTWNGLYKKFNRVSCYCCPLSNLKELKELYYNYQDLWFNIKEMDKNTYRSFRNDYTINQLEKKFQKEGKQLKLNF